VNFGRVCDESPSTERLAIRSLGICSDDLLWRASPLEVTVRWVLWDAHPRCLGSIQCSKSSSSQQAPRRPVQAIASTSKGELTSSNTVVSAADRRRQRPHKGPVSPNRAVDELNQHLSARSPHQLWPLVSV